jgi:hypothetical protein
MKRGEAAGSRQRVVVAGRHRAMNQNHSPGMYWSMIITERDKTRPAPLNSATVTTVSMLAIDVADARGRSLVIAAVMSLSKFLVAGCA